MLTFRIVNRKQPGTTQSKFYPALISPQPIVASKVIERIEKRCTLASADVKAVIDALEVEIIDCLLEGMSVRLGDLGSFRASLRSQASDASTDVSASKVKSVHIVFSPSAKIRQALDIKRGKVRLQKATSMP